MKIKRRNLLARGIELASTIPLIGLLVNNFMTKKKYYAIDTSQATYGEKFPLIQEWHELHTKLKGSLDKLWNAYEDAYHIQHTRVVPSINSEGNLYLRTETYYSWEEPENVPNHSVIESWLSAEDTLGKNLEYLAIHPLIDKRSFDKVRVSRKDLSRVSQGVVSTLMYGTEIGLLLGYEEILAHIHNKRVKEINSESQIKRRSFLKIIGALAGGGAAYLIGEHNHKVVEESRGDLEKELENINSLADVSSEEAFRRYFSESPETIISRIGEYQKTIDNTLNKNVQNKKVREKFEKLRVLCNNYYSYLSNVFQQRIPEELSELTNFGHITQKLEKISKKKKMRAGLGILLEGAAVAGAMAAVLVPGEYINKDIA